MTLAAYYYPATRTQRAKGVQGVVELHQLRDGLRISRTTWNAADKREARAIALREGATPWNF